MKYCNELTVNIDETHFPLAIYGQTKSNPNVNLTAICKLRNDSLDAYKKRFIKELLDGMKKLGEEVGVY